jgi:diamine N-acetyltransferase
MVKMTPTNLRLEPVTEDNVRAACKLELRADQEDLVAAFAPHHDNPIFHSHLWRLNIAADHQGKGYGRFAVEEVCREAVRRGHRRLTVGYHEGEHGPEEFYRRLGFRPTGEYNHGEAVAERTLEPAPQ